MKVIAYNIRQSEKERIIKANAKKHDITIIANILDENTLSYTSGKEAMIVSEMDLLDSQRLHILYEYGIRTIVTRANHTHHIDMEKATQLGINIRVLSHQLSDEQRAWQIIDLLSEPR